MITPKVYQYNESDSDTPISPTGGKNKLSQARSSTTSQVDWAYPAPSPIFGKGMSSPDVTASSSSSSESGSESDASSVSSSMSDYGSSKPHVSIRGPCLTVATPIATRPPQKPTPQLRRRAEDAGDDDMRPSSARRGGLTGLQKVGRGASGPSQGQLQPQPPQQQSSVPSSPQQQLRQVPIPIATQLQGGGAGGQRGLRQSLPMPLSSSPHRNPVLAPRRFPQYEPRESESGSDSFMKAKQSASSPGCARVSCDVDSDEPAAIIGQAITPTTTHLSPAQDPAAAAAAAGEAGAAGAAAAAADGAFAARRARTPNIMVDIDAASGTTAMTPGPVLVVVESCAGTAGYGGVSSSCCSSESESCSSARDPPKVVMNVAENGGIRKMAGNNGGGDGGKGGGDDDDDGDECGTGGVKNRQNGKKKKKKDGDTTSSNTLTGNRADDEIAGVGAVSPVSSELSLALQRSVGRKQKGKKRHGKRDSITTFRSDVDSDAGCCSPKIDSYPSSPSPDLE